MIVVDTNVLLSAVGHSNNIEVVEQVRLRDSRWIAPRLWRSEIRNVLAGHMRRGTMTGDVAASVVRQAEGLLAIQVESTTELIFQLVETSKCSAYDLEFVALATDRNLQFVTFDKQVLREFPEIAVHPADFVA